MSRLVQAKETHELASFTSLKSKGTKEYLERVSKYVPAEIVAAYTMILALGMNLGHPKDRWFLSIGFLICAIFTPFYFALMADKKQPKRMQQVISTIAFVVWSYVIGANNGVFGQALLGWYDPSFSVLFMIVFSLGSGLFVPKVGGK